MFGIGNDVNKTALGYAAYFEAFNDALPFYATGPHGACEITGSGQFLCGGAESVVVPLPDSRWVQLYAVQSAENWFEDFGSGNLLSGLASVSLEPTFRDTINSTEDYHVFISPRGECNGLYVANMTATGFEVHELHHGKSNVAFDYRIVARRKGYENMRMQDATEMHNRQVTNAQRMSKQPRAVTTATPPFIKQVQSERSHQNRQ